MKTPKVGTIVVCPVTDDDGEIDYRPGKLISINKRWATVEIDGESVRVGKTKIDSINDRDDSPRHDGYYVCRAASGRKSLDIGDNLALQLRGRTLEFVYETASKHLDQPIMSLKAKYSHLNPGQQRMCLGNRLRKSYNLSHNN